MKRYATRLGYVAGSIGELYKDMWNRRDGFKRYEVLNPVIPFATATIVFCLSFSEEARDLETGEFLVPLTDELERPVEYTQNR